MSLFFPEELLPAELVNSLEDTFFLSPVADDSSPPLEDPFSILPFAVSVGGESLSGNESRDPEEKPGLLRALCGSTNVQINVRSYNLNNFKMLFSCQRL